MKIMKQEENKTEKVQKPVLTDADAMGVVKQGVKSRFRFCDTFVPRTILYPVAVQYKPNEWETEIRAFVRQGEYVHSDTWELALKYEKEFPELNKKLVDNLKANKKPVNIKPSSSEVVTVLSVN